MWVQPRKIIMTKLLILKIRFQAFSFASKKVQGFPSDRKILMSWLSVLFHLKNLVSVFWNFNVYPRYLGKRSLCPWHQPHFQRNSDKSFISRAKQIKRNLRRFCRRKTAEDNAKIHVSPNIPCTFLLFEASAFLQIFFPRNLLFRQVLRTSVFLNSKCLTFLYFNLFISLLRNIH